MKICLVSREYPPETGKGGVGTYMYLITRALEQLGHSVFVVSLSKTAEYEYEDGRTHVSRISPKLPRGFWRLGKWIPLWLLQYSANVRSKLWELHQRFRFDVIEFAEWGGEGFFFSRKPFCPFVVKIHGPLFLNHEFDAHYQSPVRRCVEDWMERFVAVRGNAITTASKTMRDLIEKRWRIPRERMTVIPHPVDLDMFVPKHVHDDNGKTRGEINILYVGRLERRKGVHALADAAPVILQKYPEARFTFIGGDTKTGNGGCSIQGELEDRLRESRSIQATSFLGRRDRSDLVPFYQRCNVFVMPSLYEPVGFTGLEAMACGKAVIASRNSGLAEWITDGVSGLVVEPGCSRDLAEKIIRFVELPQPAREQIGVAARRVAEQFSLESVGRRLVELYESVTSNGKG